MKVYLGIACIAYTFALCGCGETIRSVPVPPELTSCADEPEAPDLPGKDQQAARDSLTLGYILALRSAWGDCRSKVDGVKAWSDALDK